MINPQIANPHICKKNNNISDQDSLWSASNIFLPTQIAKIYGPQIRKLRKVRKSKKV
jgi:hypothetical protein